MFRKFAIAAAATIALGATALIPTAASAHRHGGGGWHGGWHRHHYWGPRIVYRAPVYAAYNSCLRPRIVYTPWGPRRRWVNVCY